MLERRKPSATLYPLILTWLLINLANRRGANFWKSKCLMAQLETTAWQYLRCPVVFFVMHGKDLFFYFLFLTFKRKLWKVVYNHEISVPHGMTSLRQAVGNDMKK